MQNTPKHTDFEQDRVTHTLTTRAGSILHVSNVPALKDEEGVIYSARVSRQLERIFSEWATTQPIPGSKTTLEYGEVELPTRAYPNPVSLSIASAVERSGLTKTEVARRLGVSLPVLSRWMNPRYSTHGVDSLRRIADVLGLRLEVRFLENNGNKVA